jgi:hypothetical protein
MVLARTFEKDLNVHVTKDTFPVWTRRLVLIWTSVTCQEFVEKDLVKTLKEVSNVIAIKDTSPAPKKDVLMSTSVKSFHCVRTVVA